MKITLKIWRQKCCSERGKFETYVLDDVSTHMSFLEMLDVLNQKMIEDGLEPVSFDHDCREGICGTCGVLINGKPHGPWKGTTTCQLHMRAFQDGDEIVIEPFRSRAFPVLRDLIVDRSALDRVLQAGGYVSIRTGSAPEANAIPVPKESADLSLDASSCIGCGACVAACPNASAMLFTSAKVSHLNILPQGAPERASRAWNMVETMDAEGFGGCTNAGECEAACPKEIPIAFISRLNREFLRATVMGK